MFSINANGKQGNKIIIKNIFQTDLIALYWSFLCCLIKKKKENMSYTILFKAAKTETIWMNSIHVF